VRWAGVFENLAIWKAIAHFQPLATKTARLSIKDYSVVSVYDASVLT
jgi:hypothetical protein